MLRKWTLRETKSVNEFIKKSCADYNGNLLWDKNWKGTDSETHAHLSDLEAAFRNCTFKVYRKETRHV